MGATTEKDIGVTFDGQLSFDEHINSKVKTANIIAGVIRRSYKFVSVKTLKHLQKNNRSNKRKVEKYNKIPAGETVLVMYVPVLCVVCLFHFFVLESSLTSAITMIEHCFIIQGQYMYMFTHIQCTTSIIIINYQYYFQ